MPAVAGAVYVTGVPLTEVVAENVPQPVPLQLEPLAAQLTPALSLVVGVIDKFCLMARPACFGESETEIANETIVNETLTDLLWVGLLESVTVKVSEVALAVAVGVPAIAPVAAFRVRPAGSVPEVNDQL